MKDCELCTKLSDNVVQCSACSHRCKIQNGNTGICGVRRNYHGTLKLLVWDKPTGVAVDPMEKKPLFHFLPGSAIFSLGTFGCNLGCLFCQNDMTSQLSKTDAWRSSYTKFLNQLELWPAKKIVSYCVENNIPSIAFTYNEPSIFAEYAADVMKLAKKEGIKGVFVTNGYQTKECLKYIKPYIDAFNVDLKSFRDSYYRTICKASLEPVLDTIKRLYDMGKWIEITTLVVDGKNDSDEELSDIAKFIASVSPNIPWHLSACHPAYKLTNIRVTPKKTLDWAYHIGKMTGLTYVYLGNLTSSHENTHCPSCGKCIIERNGFDVVHNHIKKGRCPFCQTPIHGIWH